MRICCRPEQIMPAMKKNFERTSRWSPAVKVFRRIPPTRELLGFLEPLVLKGQFALYYFPLKTRGLMFTNRTKVSKKYSRKRY
jgi:hypothetical protein